MLGPGRCADLCSILTTHPAWVQSLADHPIRLGDTIMSVRGAYMKFKVHSFIIGNQPGTSSLISWAQTFRNLSGGNSLLATEKCLHTMVGVAVTQAAWVCWACWWIVKEPDGAGSSKWKWSVKVPYATQGFTGVSLQSLLHNGWFENLLLPQAPC